MTIKTTPTVEQLRRPSRMSLIDACQWIADNDEPGTDELPERIAEYVSVALVSDAWDIDAVVLGSIIWRIRHPLEKHASKV